MRITLGQTQAELSKSVIAQRSLPVLFQMPLQLVTQSPTHRPTQFFSVFCVHNP